VALLLQVFGSFDIMGLIEKYFLFISTFMVAALYIFITGLFYLILYIWKGNPFTEKKIQNVNISTAQFRREIILTIITLSLYCFTGFCLGLLNQYGKTFIYFKISDYGIIYFIISILLMIFLHDSYFYWTHRLLHRPGWYEKIHSIHHLSLSPNPWTALAFHPAEAVIHSAVFPLIFLIIPAHPAAIFIFLFYSIFMNVLGHSGYQFSPYNKRINKWDWWSNSSKQHDEHHQYGKDNYGLYFTFWDYWMKTNRK